MIAKLEVLTGHVSCLDLLAWLVGAYLIFVRILLLGWWFVVLVYRPVVSVNSISGAFDSTLFQNSELSVECYNMRRFWE